MEFLLKTKKDRIGSMWETRQKHWRRYVDICKVCSIEWDFIGKTEHFEQDHNYMLKKLGILAKGRNTSLPDWFKNFAETMF